MEQVADVVSRKKQRIQSLEDKKVKTEEEIEQVELRLEDLEDKLSLNYQELDNLVVKEKNSRDIRNNLNKLMTQNVLISLIIFGFGVTINMALSYLILVYLLLNVPKYIKLISELKSTWKLDITSDIKVLKNAIAMLESDRDHTHAILRKLEYTIADIDSEKQVIEEILKFIQENRSRKEKGKINISKEKEFCRSRVNPTCS